ncbi:hypothetical protein TNCV_2450391 [Trichonephila clavipes]|nr:hypothetical protein TNCV_2450391 [Trichonephila clavipes]
MDLSIWDEDEELEQKMAIHSCNGIILCKRAVNFLVLFEDFTDRCRVQMAAVQSRPVKSGLMSSGIYGNLCGHLGFKEPLIRYMAKSLFEDMAFR